MDLAPLCREIELMLSDVDGVLTDGRLVLDNRGVEAKQFHIHDGMGIRLWHEAGYRFGVITHRSSEALKIRTAELGIQIVRQGADDKLAATRQILAELGVSLQQVCYIGDDFLDLPVVRAVGLGVAVADAAAELRRAARYVTTTPGGSGAVRETIETILKAQHRWDDVIRPYLK
jgi:3-deoxy-D-manno-octulosonate 8-phosphate phosphatase (KDO 8-P phosphatase)